MDDYGYGYDSFDSYTGYIDESLASAPAALEFQGPMIDYDTGFTVPQYQGPGIDPMTGYTPQQYQGPMIDPFTGETPSLPTSPAVPSSSGSSFDWGKLFGNVLQSSTQVISSVVAKQGPQIVRQMIPGQSSQQRPGSLMFGGSANMLARPTTGYMPTGNTILGLSPMTWAAIAAAGVVGMVLLRRR